MRQAERQEGDGAAGLRSVKALWRLQARELLKGLPSLVDVNIPPQAHLTVCGDVHGQFYDLLNIFQLNGLPSEDNPYVFNGVGLVSRC